MIVINGRQNFFRKYGIERNKERRRNAGCGTNDAEIDLSLGSNEETSNDNEKTGKCFGTGCHSQNEKGEESIEDNGERSRDAVEGDFDIFETEVVEGDHAHKDER